MSRPWCYICRRAQVTCICRCITPVRTRTRFVLLTHPMEHRRVRNGTGRLTHLALPNSEVHVGTDFRRHARVNALIDDPATDCHLVYPGAVTRNLSGGEYRPRPRQRPVFFLIDSTWSCATKMLRRSANVRALPRVGFDLGATSDFSIKRQPRPECLATIEAAHRCLTLLGADGHEDFGPEESHRLLAPFRRIVEIQRDYPGAPADGDARSSLTPEPRRRQSRPL